MLKSLDPSSHFHSLNYQSENSLFAHQKIDEPSVWQSHVFNYVLENESLVFKIERIAIDNTEYAKKDISLMQFNVYFTITLKDNSKSVIHICKRISEIETFFQEISMLFDLDYNFDMVFLYELVHNHTLLCKKFNSKKTIKNRFYSCIVSKVVKPLVQTRPDKFSMALYLFWENFLCLLIEYFKNIIIATCIWESSIFMTFFQINNQLALTCQLSSDELKRYILLKVLGRGSVGKVFLAVDTLSCTFVAIKCIHKFTIKNLKELEHAFAEKDVLVKIGKGKKSSFIIQLLSAFQTKTDLFLIFPYYSGGDLAVLLSKNRTLDYSLTKMILAQIVLGLEYLQAKGIIYRDLKPENILFDDKGFVVLVDFGLSKIIDQDELARTFCGTYDYLAPEILLGLPYSFSVDIWSLGIVFYEMLLGISPFWSDNSAVMCSNIINVPVQIPKDAMKTNDARSLCLLLLEKDPIKRISIQEIKQHPFFDEIDWVKLSQKQVSSLYRPANDPLVQCINFDPMFTNLPVTISPPQTRSELIMPSYHLDGYSFSCAK